ncbi:phosphoglycerate dehydrogenase [Pedobacter ginsengisoli]|uniref:Phosphoglycerate dehydrogenase n=1 Tax=Pedobacter ginsengisoli TaxID=363852 RepID=A0A2D1U4K3_9SPHI|nr:hydroxyacid dehydrogenase [Pedobacter ginsengisoli]ATP56543.1 phosphoglycerate dehydrogenase [Pedobacter ginsengisoli]
MKKSVLLLETIDDEALTILEEHVNVFTGYDDASLKNILENQDVHAVITRGKGQINKALMEAIPTLQVAARCGVGLDNVDVQEATARKIMVINAPGSNAATIAEHTLSLMLMLMRNMYESVAQVKQDNWNWRNQYSGDELNGKTLGILGMGNIGKRVAKLGEAFGMNILYWSRSSQDLPYTYLSMDEVLEQSDVVSLHLPFTKETGTLIKEEQLALMKPGALLVNTARGALIDHEALLNALNEQRISGFAADVLPEEPPVHGFPILHHSRSLITPHSGSLTASTYRQMCVLTVKNVVAVLTGEEPDNRSIFNFSEL